ncbi:unnamed protein product [Spirodela intermedia]|uniref:Uncharacterized protein n=1 Tax=Spirodela intermedia TaxID=51605 RepID=A0A7I8KM14_SPIIN|nr:unnamed protein product [Spirodela intermedia]
MLSSSSRRESRMVVENPQTKKVGCMSGIFFFLNMNRHNSRKRLLSGKNRSSSSNSSSSKTPESSPANPTRPAAAAPPAAVSSGEKSVRRLSCEIPRSPTLPSEIRRLDSPVCSPRKPPALVARLMGLDDSPPPHDSPQSAAEKRRKLLGALERCDEDLMTLKRIIDALRAAETHRDSGGGAGVEEKRCLEEEDGKPSPVSVLDAPLSSPAPGVRWRQQQLPPGAPQPHLHRHAGDHLLLDGHHLVLPAFACKKGPPSLPPEDQRPIGPTNLPRPRRRWWRRQRPCSKAMAESVEEVSESGLWEEMWELDMIWVELERSIVGELVAELVKELGFRRGRPSSLPFFTGCRKRLFF